MKLRKSLDAKRKQRIIRRTRIRKRISGTAEKPRLTVYKGATGLFAQAIDDTSSKTMLGLATYSKEVKGKTKGSNMKSAAVLGELLAVKCAEKGIKEVVFDKGPYKYHGVIKEFADAVRKGGVKF